MPENSIIHRRLNRKNGQAKFGLLCIIQLSAFVALAFSADAHQQQLQESTMSSTGIFEINLRPQNDEMAPVGRMLIDKKYSGGLVGTGTGQMISKRTASGTAVYSAIEEFEGSLDGKSGTFTLIHNGQMSAESQTLDITILDGSGSGELENISGALEIIQEENTHRYVLTYDL